MNCHLAERDTFILIIIQNAMMEGRIQKTTLEGESTVESLDPDTVHKLLHYLDLTNQVTSRTELKQPLQCFPLFLPPLLLCKIPSRRKVSPCWW